MEYTSTSPPLAAARWQTSGAQPRDSGERSVSACSTEPSRQSQGRSWQAVTSVSLPGHGAPPQATPRQVRVRVAVPGPQEAEHADHDPQLDHVPSTGQHCVLQAKTWVVSPVHGAPPQDGEGLTHARDWDWVPPPQGAEQGVGSVQGPQSPSTGGTPTHVFSVHVPATHTWLGPQSRPGQSTG
jgi:hypothetical protein